MNESYDPATAKEGGGMRVGPQPLRCRLGFHSKRRDQGHVGYCLRVGCYDFKGAAVVGGLRIRYLHNLPPKPPDDRPVS